jgi:hypothetical protein
MTWRRQRDLKVAARFGGVDATWRRRCDLEAAAVRLGIEGSCAM